MDFAIEICSEPCSPLLQRALQPTVALNRRSFVIALNKLQRISKWIEILRRDNSPLKHLNYCSEDPPPHYRPTQETAGLRYRTRVSGGKRRIIIYVIYFEKRDFNVLILWHKQIERKLSNNKTIMERINGVITLKIYRHSEISAFIVPSCGIFRHFSPRFPRV